MVLGRECGDQAAEVPSSGDPGTHVEPTRHGLSAERGTSERPRSDPAPGCPFPAPDPTEESAATFSPPVATE
ncbi:hypothetical protein GCM10023084_63410 [Streptomyces lacrimifluminis]|uniref:Uncharacterized protein n=1 Tax=Streptomyces lacrimifluminis TaxID=1500077 RepID=A0A917NZ38_9ACTN|nr:hypothetical protein GCM10012282_44450 [Streptomyces lacrimifluminis]